MLEKSCYWCRTVYPYDDDACPNCGRDSSELVVDGKLEITMTDELARKMSDEDLEKLFPFYNPLVREYLRRRGLENVELR